MWMVVSKLDWTKPVNGPKCLVLEWIAMSRDFWILDTHTVRYSDESGIMVFSIQTVTVFLFCFIQQPSPMLIDHFTCSVTTPLSRSFPVLNIFFTNFFFLQRYIVEHSTEDCLLNGFRGKNSNPFKEKSSCMLLWSKFLSTTKTFVSSSCIQNHICHK